MRGVNNQFSLHRDSEVILEFDRQLKRIPHLPLADFECDPVRGLAVDLNHQRPSCFCLWRVVRP